MALGADRDGVDMGAAELDRLLRARLDERGYDWILRRLNDSVEITVQERDVAVRDTLLHTNALHVNAIATAARELASIVSASVLANHLALVLGGDHALSIGSLAGAALSRRLGVIWIDTHADINSPETSPSGHVHGMPLAAAIGRGPQALVDIARQSRLDLANVVYVGLRNVDPGERALLRDSEAGLYSMERIDALGVDEVVAGTVARLRDRGVEHVHVSFDLDVLDPTIMPGTGTRDPGGLTYREAHRIFRLLRESDLPIVSADVVELNPLLDPSGDSTIVAAGLTAALLGEEMI
jgi:arginase